MLRAWGGPSLPIWAKPCPPPWRDRGVVEGSVCLDLCRAGALKPPFVMVGTEVVEQASVDKVFEVLRGRLP